MRSSFQRARVLHRPGQVTELVLLVDNRNEALVLDVHSDCSSRHLLAYTHTATCTVIIIDSELLIQPHSSLALTKLHLSVDSKRLALLWRVGADFNVGDLHSV